MGLRSRLLPSWSNQPSESPSMASMMLSPCQPTTASAYRSRASGSSQSLDPYSYTPTILLPSLWAYSISQSTHSLYLVSGDTYTTSTPAHLI